LSENNSWYGLGNIYNSAYIIKAVAELIKGRDLLDVYAETEV
jgi:hypothetical protein